MSEAPEWPLKRDLACPFNPPPELLKRTVEQPLARARIWDGTSPWIVTKHADVRALLTDPRLSHVGHLDGFPHVSPDFKLVSNSDPSFLFMDDPEHSRLRRLVTRPFSARRVEAMRPTIQRFTDELIDALLAGPKPADLVAALAVQLPMRVICDVLGVPEEKDHWEQMQRNNDAMLYLDESGEAFEGSIAQTKYFYELLDSKRENPGDDLMTDLLTPIDAGEITQQEAARMAVMLLGAGHETTSSMISLGLLSLLLHPEQAAEVRDTDDPKVVANAVEELLRYLSITQDTVRRIAVEDIEIRGVTIKAGDGLVFAQHAANWDAEAFPERPDQVDIHRPNANRNIAFGFGTHLCLGATLSRVELQIVYRTVLRRIPTLALATGIDQIPFKHDQIAHGVYELPVTW